MFKFEGVKSITIEYLNLHDLFSGNTGNILAEKDIPIFLKEAIENGTKVLVKGIEKNLLYQLVWEESIFKVQKIEN
ncbi:hypothetical protein Desor_1952 [Desulfosporosinus orientis DSM 765]|uniref:Uncharacterized protein n=1 Tax=Desulfosporosinus orientis (strain ATCC 19365 / DSM 765 / NCIMB 8382 / VKM B-1628 / Singapore I) TaxID=768706 RepID=G7WD85_DESOD|nr:hypothetical protein [Desulfosporosinus orientis]AET67570.1 hypothetical protein Desor_1952 [Desulfosporosinus orientis DSM 765]